MSLTSHVTPLKSQIFSIRLCMWYCGIRFVFEMTPHQIFISGHVTFRKCFWKVVFFFSFKVKSASYWRITLHSKPNWLNIGNVYWTCFNWPKKTHVHGYCCLSCNIVVQCCLDIILFSRSRNTKSLSFSNCTAIVTFCTNSHCRCVTYINTRETLQVFPWEELQCLHGTPI